MTEDSRHSIVTSRPDFLKWFHLIMRWMGIDESVPLHILRLLLSSPQSKRLKANRIRPHLKWWNSVYTLKVVAILSCEKQDNYVRNVFSAWRAEKVEAGTEIRLIYPIIMVCGSPGNLWCFATLCDWEVTIFYPHKGAKPGNAKDVN